MSYVKLILSLFQVLSWIIKELDRRELLKEGERKALLEGMQKEAADVEKALSARRDTRHELERNPNSVRNDDGFKRKD